MSEGSTAAVTTVSENIATSSDTIAPLLLDIVSQLTGYPTEMLQLEMDIEADLGIDSIKRVEILSTLEEKMPDLPKISPDQMGTLKTLGEIIAYLTAPANEANLAENPSPQVSLVTIPQVASEKENVPRPVSAPLRSVMEIIAAPPLSTAAESKMDGRRIYLYDDGSDLTQAIAKQLTNNGIVAEVLSPKQIEAIHKGAFKPHKAAGLIILQFNDASQRVGVTDGEAPFLETFFRISQCFGKKLVEAAQETGALFATVTRLDGVFGFRHPEEIDPVVAGLAGLPKTAAHEWKGVVCRALDIAPAWCETDEIAQAIVQELLQADAKGPTEIGLDANMRLTPVATHAPYPEPQTDATGLGSEDVVIVTGGARGVTAAAASKLAANSQSVMVLIGRSPEPQPEPEWLVDAHDEASMKKAILSHDFTDLNPRPSDLEERFRHYRAGREIQATLSQIEQAGATAVYYQADVRDAEAIEKIITSVRDTYGSIKAIIHGAGVLEDRLIVDKTPQQFSRVVETKVRGLQSLLSATQTDPLQHIVLFSSVAARWGNRGQVDYAIANEILNKIAQQEAKQRPDCRVVSINWGPWDGGMVTPSLKREFARRQIDLLSLESGANALLQEMSLPKDNPAEVIIGSALLPSEAAPAIVALTDTEMQPKTPAAGNGLALSFKRDLDVQSHPVLEAHKLNGQAVVPFALIAEWFGHGALHANPGLVLHGIDDMRLLQGIKIAHDPRTIRVLAGKMQKNGSFFNVDVELRDGFKNNIDVVHSRAQAVLTDADFPAPENYTRPGDITVAPYHRTVEEVYAEILFHGESLKGLRSIVGSSAEGMVAEISSAPEPVQWMTNPMRSQWIIDPLALDCAFQMACVWCYDHAGAVSLPSYCGSYRQYRTRFPEDGMTAVLKITDLREHKMCGDITFLDDQEACVAQILGYEAVIDVSLNRAFKPQNSAA